jgi:hypothetical protein
MAEFTVVGSAQEFFDLLTDEADERYTDQAIALVRAWFARDDGAALYRNVDLGHPEVGHTKVVSWGSLAAQIETDVRGETTPPKTLPDIGNDINWRYQLVAFYRPAARGGDSHG